MSIVVIFYLNLRGEHSDLCQADTFLLKVVIVLQRHVSWVELIVWGTVVFLEAGVFLALTLHALDHSAEVKS